MARDAIAAAGGTAVIADALGEEVVCGLGKWPLTTDWCGYGIAGEVTGSRKSLGARVRTAEKRRCYDAEKVINIIIASKIENM